MQQPETKLPKTLRTELALCERIITSLAHRRCLSREEQEDFSSWAWLRLVENGDAIFERFEGKSTLATYLTTVTLNLLRDYRIAKWGKYRPSAVARRLGTVAVRLEMLLVRDGLPLDQAIEVLRRNERVREPPAELEAIAARLPVRVGRRFDGEEALAQVPAGERADDTAQRSEAVAKARRVEVVLREALSTVSAEDRMILKLHLEDGFSVADVARALRLEQKPLYRRIDQLTDRLRREMEARGVQRADVDAVMEWEEAEVRVNYGLDEEIAPPGPSQQEGGR